MIGYITRSKYSTYTRAGVFTFLPNTGQISGTLRVNNTFRLALNVGVSNIARNTRTGTHTRAGPQGHKHKNWNTRTGIQEHSDWATQVREHRGTGT